MSQDDRRPGETLPLICVLYHQRLDEPYADELTDEEGPSKLWLM